jgi:hypothetical protein
MLARDYPVSTVSTRNPPRRPALLPGATSGGRRPGARDETHGRRARPRTRPGGRHLLEPAARDAGPHSAAARAPPATVELGARRRHEGAARRRDARRRRHRAHGPRPEAVRPHPTSARCGRRPGGAHRLVRPVVSGRGQSGDCGRRPHPSRAPGDRAPAASRSPGPTGSTTDPGSPCRLGPRARRRLSAPVLPRAAPWRPHARDAPGRTTSPARRRRGPSRRADRSSSASSTRGP